MIKNKIITLDNYSVLDPLIFGNVIMILYALYHQTECAINIRQTQLCKMQTTPNFVILIINGSVYGCLGTDASSLLVNIDNTCQFRLYDSDHSITSDIKVCTS